MTLEFIVFVAAVLFGIVLYWRESQGNGVYRFFNKMMNSKELQMRSANKKGFVFQQSLLLRIVFITGFFLLLILIIRFLIPVDLATISMFASMIVGTLIGTYVANFIFKSNEVIDENSDSLEDIVQNTIEKGKDFIEDLKSNETKEIEVEKKVEEQLKTQEKSARERLKDKGLL